MIINTCKYYAIVYENKYRPYALMGKYAIWNSKLTAIRNYNQRKYLKFSEGGLIYNKMKIIEIDIENPHKSKFVKINKGEQK